MRAVFFIWFANICKKIEMIFLSFIMIRYTHSNSNTAIMAKTMNIDTSRIVKLLAVQFDFDANEGLRIVAASTARSARTARTDRTDFLEELAIAESKDEAALAKAKMSPADKKEAAAAKKAEREAKKAAKEAKPKRAPTGYLMFCKERRPDVKAALEELLEEGKKLAPTDTVKELAAQWKIVLSEEERAEWNKKAAENKEAMKSGTSSETASSSDEASDETVVSAPAPPAPPAPVVPPPPTEPAPEPQATARKSRAKKAPKEKKLKTVDETKDGDSSD
jgi:hypothetical protein